MCEHLFDCTTIIFILCLFFYSSHSTIHSILVNKLYKTKIRKFAVFFSTKIIFPMSKVFLISTHKPIKIYFLYVYQFIIFSFHSFTSIYFIILFSIPFLVFMWNENKKNWIKLESKTFCHEYLTMNSVGCLNKLIEFGRQQRKDLAIRKSKINILVTELNCDIHSSHFCWCVY